MNFGIVAHAQISWHHRRSPAAALKELAKHSEEIDETQGAELYQPALGP